MEKLRFEFVVKASEDPKSNVMCITSITDTNKNTFLLPERFQPVHLHEAVTKTQTFQKVKSTLQRRHEKRQIWISVSQEIKDNYIDGDGNMQFKGYFLEEKIPDTYKQSSTAGVSEEAWTKILENFTEVMKDKSKCNNVRKLTEKFVIEKFSKKTSNVSQWMSTFETECTRLGIEEDIKKIEALRLFLEESYQDWYSSMLIKYTVNSEWSIWMENFCETYADKGWSPVRYAMLFKYRQGPLLEYAIKKERLLLEINKSIDKPTLIDLIAIGLPNFITDKIDRNSLKDTKDLFNNIRGLEHLINKKIVDKKSKDYDNKVKEKDINVKPCKICEKENKGVRYHPESSCWFKNKNSERPKRDQIKNVNNSELEIELNEMDQKNF